MEGGQRQRARDAGLVGFLPILDDAIDLFLARSTPEGRHIGIQVEALRHWAAADADDVGDLLREQGAGLEEGCHHLGQPRFRALHGPPLMCSMMWRVASPVASLSQAARNSVLSRGSS